MNLGALAFMNPWLLTGLLALPVIYWLLRTVPPSPRQVEFPPTRILIGLENREKTPHKTPWWLMLIRLLAAALVILALAEPILNPDRRNVVGAADGPVAIVIDNGWPAATHWSDRARLIDSLIGEAEGRGRPVVLIATADAPNAPARIEAPKDARVRAAALEPVPRAPDRTAAAERLERALADARTASIVWLSDGIDHGGAAAFADKLSARASGNLAVVETGNDNEALGLFATVATGGRLVATVHRTEGGHREGLVLALSARGERLGEARFTLAPGATSTTVSFDLPLELRNQVARVSIATERSAGAISLMDARSKWNRVGLLSATAREEAQPLLDPLYYIRKAVSPFAEISETDTVNLAEGLERILTGKPSILVMADIGTLAPDEAERVAKWTKDGGVLVRFAGPRLEKGGDELLPTPLRIGGRELGGALSWSTPQPLADFTDNSLFAGLDVPDDVRVRRQVLADPTQLGPDVDVWARLRDGTPLVTSRKFGEGRIVLFHVTANAKWSDLPLSGLFVNMLRRIATLGSIGGGTVSPTGIAMTDGATARREMSQSVLPPIQTLDGFGALRPPPPTAEAIERKAFERTPISLNHPPGYYGAAGHPRALNIMTEKSELKPLPGLPSGAVRQAYQSETSTDVKPWLLGAALALLLIDVIAILFLQGGALFARRRTPMPSPTASALLALAVLTAAALLALAIAPPVLAQSSPSPNGIASGAPKGKLTAEAQRRADELAIRATSRVTFGYVMTGDPTTDGTSQAGLEGLVKVLTARTAVEPGEPVGIDITRDEIAFFPVVYWPVIANAKEPGTDTLAKIDAYMKQGGMIIFDTQDFSQGIPMRLTQRIDSNQVPPLQRLIGRLDIPRLEPVPEGHVLTKSFYLLRRFPGRWDGGELWVEAGGGATIEEGRAKSRVDGVSSILITSNDFASAWALDERNLPMFPVVPGGEQQREMAYRTGVNIVMYALTGNYKADQVHIPALLERLGQ